MFEVQQQGDDSRLLVFRRADRECTIFLSSELNKFGILTILFILSQ